MALTSDRMLTALKAVGEETRLRIVALLAHGELTVSDLVDILGQSQPRISRHLRLLTEAGVVDKHREGTWAFFGLTPRGPIRDAIDAVLAGMDGHDPVLAADGDRRSLVQQRRSTVAQEYFAEIADSWDHERSLHAPDDVVEAAILETAAERPYRRVLDLGTGTGRMLQLLAHDPDRVDRATGLDTSHSMLAVARANLERAELRHIELRQGDVYSPPFDRGEFDLVVLHQVLHFLDDPGRAVREAARLLAPGGRLLIVDFAPHTLEFLRTGHAHRRLGFRADVVETWLTASDLVLVRSRTVDPDDGGRTDDRLTVSLWVGVRPLDATPVVRTPQPDHERTAPPTIDVSFEVFPPKTEAGLEQLAETARRLVVADPVFISVTYGAGGSQRHRSFDAIQATAASGATIAAHLTCVGQPVEEISEVMDAYQALGVEQIVALRGDPPGGIDAPYQPHPHGYHRTADLVAAAVARQQFEVIVSAYPERHPQSPTDDHDLDVLAEKVSAGATRAITQMFFDVDVFARFLDRVRRRGIEIPIVPGVFPIHSFPSVASFAARCGASIPAAVAERFAGCEDDPAATHDIAADHAAEQIERLTALGVDHVHLYTLNRADLALAVCDRLGRSLAVS